MSKSVIKVVLIFYICAWQLAFTFLIKDTFLPKNKKTSELAFESSDTFQNAAFLKTSEIKFDRSFEQFSYDSHFSTFAFQLDNPNSIAEIISVINLFNENINLFTALKLRGPPSPLS